MDNEVHPKFAKYMNPEAWVHRDDASVILAYVGENSPAGNYPQDIPPYLLGRAVRRLVYSYFTSAVPDKSDLVTLEQDEARITREFLAGLLGLKL